MGVVVRDMDKTVKYLASLGIGPFQSPQGLPFINRESRGKPASYASRLMFARVGEIELELIQPMGGESIHQEFLDRKGEGLHHLGFFVDDLEKGVDWVVRQGYTVIQTGRRLTGGGYAYFDTDRTGGIIMELIQR